MLQTAARKFTQSRSPSWSLIASSLGLFCSVGCGNGGVHVKVPQFDSPGMATKSFEAKDSNHDDRLSPDEVSSWPGLKSAFKAIDANADGKLDRDELESHFAKYAQGSIGLQSLTCFVFSGGRPVSDVVVEFTPEPLFAEYDKALRGTTGRDGSCPMLPIEGGMPGAAPGMYRVTLSKKNAGQETIPKKFNLESELGFEVSNALGGAPAKFDVGR